MDKIREFFNSIACIALISFLAGCFSAIIEPYKNKVECFRGIAAAVAFGVMTSKLLYLPFLANLLELTAENPHTEDIRSGIISVVAYSSRWIAPRIKPCIKRIMDTLLRRFEKES